MALRDLKLLEGVHCTIEIRRPAQGVVVVKLSGTDTGELGDAPFVELAPDLAINDHIELFIDASSVRGASIDVSGQWASWMRTHKKQLVHVHMLTGTRFIQLSADFVRRFAELGEAMRLYTERASFDDALAEAVESGV
jgi:hypothetical protein